MATKLSKQVNRFLWVCAVGDDVAGTNTRTAIDPKCSRAFDECGGRMKVAVWAAEEKKRLGQRAEIAPTEGRRRQALQDPPPRTQNRAQCGWFSRTVAVASARVWPTSNCLS